MSADETAAQHVVRTLRALELLAERPRTQADLARGLATHRRTARRLLTRLVAEGYVEPRQSGRQTSYAATPRLTVIGRQVAEGLDLVNLGRRHLASLSPYSPVRFIAMPARGGVAFVHVEADAGSDGANVASAVHRTAPSHATAAGKVFLSADTELLHTVLNQERLRFTAATIVARADLLLELAGVREQGFAAEDGEHRVGARSAASGVLDYTGRTVAALGATLVDDGMNLSQLGKGLKQAAEAFSREIGSPEAPAPMISADIGEDVTGMIP